MARRTHLKPFLALILGAGIAGGAHRAVADDTRGFTLEWIAPPECPSPAEVKAMMARLLGEPPSTRSGQGFTALAEVTHEQDWSVSITTHQDGYDGRRSLTAASCRDVAGATALILALAIDPEAVAATSQASMEGPAPLPPAPPSPPATVSPARPPSAPLDMLLGLHAQAGNGILPGWDAGIGATMGLAGEYWRVELRGTYGLRRNQVAHAPAPPGAYGEFNYLGGALAACLAFGGEELTYGPCAGAELGQVSAKGVGASIGFPAHTTWFALGGGGYAAIRLGTQVHLPLHLDVLAPLRRPEYVFQDATGRVFQAPAVGIRMLGGIEWRF